MVYTQAPFTPDISGATVVPAHECNVRPGDNHPKVNVFHTPEEEADEIEVTPYYFSRPIYDAHGNLRRASTHYYADNDGDLFQMVPERYGAIANGVTAGRSYPEDTNPGISLNLQSRNIEIEGRAATIHRTCKRGGSQWMTVVLWTLAGYHLHGIPLDLAHNIGHYRVSNVRWDPGQLDIAAIVEDARTLLAQETEPEQEEAEMAKLLRLGADDGHGGLKWTAFTYVTDGFLKRHITDPDAMKELQDAGVWPSGDAPLVSRAALEELEGDL